jgi:hypothetical protein
LIAQASDLWSCERREATGEPTLAHHGRARDRRHRHGDAGIGSHHLVGDTCCRPVGCTNSSAPRGVPQLGVLRPIGLIRRENARPVHRARISHEPAPEPLRGPSSLFWPLYPRSGAETGLRSGFRSRRFYCCSFPSSSEWRAPPALSLSRESSGARRRCAKRTSLAVIERRWLRPSRRSVRPMRPAGGRADQRLARRLLQALGASSEESVAGAYVATVSTSFPRTWPLSLSSCARFTSARVISSAISTRTSPLATSSAIRASCTSN